MYRDYENPRVLEERLRDINERIKNCYDEYELLDLCAERDEIKERINFAYQDEVDE